MSEADQRVQELWRGVFGEPPPIASNPALAIAALVSHLPPAPPYGERTTARGPLRDDRELGAG